MTSIQRIVLPLLICNWIAFAGACEPRRFEVRDSIEMSYFGTRISSAPPDLDEDDVFSPDHRHFVKITHRGVLPQGVTEGTLWLFDTAAMEMNVASPETALTKPVPLARMSAAVNSGLQIYALDAGNTMSVPHWANDSRSITFLGRDGRANHQLFTVDINTKAIRALTPPTQDVLAYSESAHGWAYLAGPDADAQIERAYQSAGPGVPDMTVGTNTPLMSLLYPYFRGNAFSEPLRVEVWRVDETARPVMNVETGRAVAITTRYSALLASLSPDSTQLVTIAEASGAEQKQDAEGSQDSPSALQYRTIDLITGQITALPGIRIEPGSPGRYEAAWAPDGREIAITRASELGGRPKSGQPSACEVALLSMHTSHVQCVTTPDSKGPSIFSLNWTQADRIDARYRGHGEFSDRVLTKRGPAWVINTRTHQPVRPLELRVSEGLNEPPVLTATNPKTGQRRAIFDPNPQLTHIALGSVSVYHWKDPHGHELIGGLVKPSDFASGKPYGLVIQTHGFNPSAFFRSGYSDTSNAGRALAGRDLLVLQVQESHPAGAEPTWQDGVELGLDGYLAAIDQLAGEGLVDPARVGISGYSYSGWLVATSITRAPQRFAAAEIANSDPVTLTGYYAYVGTPVAKIAAESYVGARPYGEGMKTWLERAPSFSTDQITAPILLQPADPWHLIGIWDIYAALVDQGKPVELQYIRNGEHNIMKPLHILAHQEMIVDWFDFWLNHHESDDPAKADQYARWKRLRDARH